jgi:DHA1 family tetracycline resistance protein-like MFS transporter
MLAVGIVIPILPSIFFGDFKFLHFPNEEITRWSYCMLLGCFSFFQLFGAPVLGGLSDKKGRKPVLQVSLIASVLSYLLFSYAIYTQKLWLMFLSRSFQGFFAGNLSVLFSAISDKSKNQDKAKNFALVGMAFGLGIVLGPTIGGLLSESKYGFGLYSPFLFTAFLSLLNLFFVQFFFTETLTNPLAQKINFFKGIENVYKALTNRKLNKLFSMTFLNSLGFSFFTQFFAVYLLDFFHATRAEVGLIFGWSGLWIIFTQGFLLRKTLKAFEVTQVLKFSMIGLSISLLMIIFPKSIGMLLIVNMFISVFHGHNSPSLLSLVSNSASADLQGEILGINQSMMSLAQFIPTLVIGLFGENLHTIPFVSGASSVFVGYLIYRLIFLPKFMKHGH